MTPLEREIIHEVAARHQLAPELIVGRSRAHTLVLARIEISKLLTFRGYTTAKIGAVLNRDHTSIVYYLGTGRKQPVTKRRWHRPKVRTLWKKLKKTEIRAAPPPAKRRLYLVPYAGAYMPEYEWKERCA